jgi:minor histocompatibility antigen H13
MVSSDDAWMFPIGGSVMLVGLYVLFKYLNKDYLNYLFTAYFGVIGVFAVSNVFLLFAGVDVDWGIGV